MLIERKAHLSYRRVKAAQSEPGDCPRRHFALGAWGGVHLLRAARLGETVSLLPVAAEFALALPRGDCKWRLLGVALLAIAVFLRLQNGIFRVALVVALLVSRRYRESLEAAFLLAAAGVAYGAVDMLTWVTGSTPLVSIPLQPARRSQRLPTGVSPAYCA